MQIDFKKGRRYLPYIAFVGIGIGTANFILNDNLNWIQWIIQSLSTSFVIGYPLVIIAANRSYFEQTITPSWKVYSVLCVLFAFIGTVATEIEYLLRTLAFFNEPYQAFSQGKMYVFNAIISLFLGGSFFLNKHFFPPEEVVSEAEQADLDLEESQPEDEAEQPALIRKVPVKQKDSIALIPVEEIVLFEAYDNYSFLYDLKGEKRLCDYSLLFLQQRLDENFLRVHRKHIVNSRHIKEITPYANGRYVIQFDRSGFPEVISSKGYSENIRALIKLK